MNQLSRRKAFFLIVVLIAIFPLGQLNADDERCPFALNYWANTPASWSVNSLMLGSQFYNQTELIPFMLGSTPNDASAQLAAQLAAAKLNIASGIDPVPVTSAILTGDTLLSSYPGRLPFSIDPNSPAGQAMLTTAATLNTFNLGQQSPGCALTPTPTGTLTATPTGTLTMTPTATATSTPVRGPVTIIVEGPVQQINVNIITIYDFDIVINPTNPLLTVIEIGDIVRVVGDIDDDDDNGNRSRRVVIVAITVIIVDIDVVVDNSGILIWRDRGDCSNPPPDWAPADGWRRRCEVRPPSPGGGGSPGGGRGGGDDDDD